jgi:SOS-response transcriptional repressor LexA
MGMAYLFNRSVEWFYGGEDSRPRDVSDSRVAALSRVILLGARAEGVSLDSLFGLEDASASPWTIDPAWADFDAQPIAASDGAGSEVPPGEPLVHHVRLDPRWLREHALNSDYCDMISVSGDSMHPTLPDGCTILVDRSSVELRDSGIFVLRAPDGLVVKRVRRGFAGWTLVSDNPRWSPVPLDADVPVVGEVRWAGGFL